MNNCTSVAVYKKALVHATQGNPTARQRLSKHLIGDKPAAQIVNEIAAQ